MDTILKRTFSREECVKNILLLNSSFIKNLGLMHGKMGIAIYFFHLAKETQNVSFRDFAEKLIDEIFEEIDISTPLDFENGLAGIGWGIEYLVQEGFIEGNTDEVLKDIDNQLLLFKDLFRGMKFPNSLIGLGTYFLKRIQNQSTLNSRETETIKKQMLLYVVNELELQIKETGIVSLIHGPQYFEHSWDYALVINFLLQTYKLNLGNLDVSRLLYQLISPLNNNLPQLHSHRLLLFLVVEKMKYCNIRIFLSISLDKLSRNIADNIENDLISSELLPGSAFLLNGSSGIEWIYLQLWQLTGDIKYKDLALQWKSFSLNLEESDLGYAGFRVVREDEKKAFGLLEGLAGLGITWMLEKKDRNKKHVDLI